MDLKGKLPWLLLVLLLFNFLVYAGFKLVVIKASDRVIEKLQKEYSPSPFGPGFDPDKADTDALEKPLEKPLYEMSQSESMTKIYDIVKESDDWREEWERQRGFSSLER